MIISSSNILSACSSNSSQKHQYLKSKSSLNKSNLNVSSSSTLQSKTPHFTNRYMQKEQLQNYSTSILNQSSEMNFSSYQANEKQLQIEGLQEQIKKLNLIIDQLNEQNHQMQARYDMLDLTLKKENNELRKQLEKQRLDIQSTSPSKQEHQLQKTENSMNLIQDEDTMRQLKSLIRIMHPEDNPQEVQDLNHQIKNKSTNNEENSYKFQQQPIRRTFRHECDNCLYLCSNKQILINHLQIQPKQNPQLIKLTLENLQSANRIKQYELNEQNYQKAMNIKNKENYKREIVQIEKIIIKQDLLKQNLNASVLDTVIKQYSSKLAQIQVQIIKQQILINQLKECDRSASLKINLEKLQLNKLQLNIVQYKSQIDDLNSVNRRQQLKVINLEVQRNQYINQYFKTNQELQNQNDKNLVEFDDKMVLMQQRVDINNTQILSLRSQAEIINNYNDIDEQVAQVDIEAMNLQEELNDMSDDFGQAIIDRLFEIQAQAFDLGNFIDEQL